MIPIVSILIYIAMPIWNDITARHLLARCSLGYTTADLAIALAQPLESYVDNILLAPVEIPTPPGEWINEDPALTDPATIGVKRKELTNWWAKLMLEKNSLQEKMVLFWHNHFVSEMIKVYYPQRMYWQNNLFRKHAFGNFRELTKAVTVDPAMLHYLDGMYNTTSRPNENYARELLELFTIGIGNYSETDVKEAARALTGWQINKLTSVFNPKLFDNTNKTIFGVTRNFDHNTLIDLIFQNPKTAEHICTKIYKEFVHYKPDTVFVKRMADVLIKNNYEIRPVLSFLFKSEHFYESRFIGSKIKSPVQLLIGTLKSLHLQNPDFNYLNDILTQLQQSLFNPPGVKGWEGQRKWISSATYPVRNAVTDSFVNGKKPNGQSISFSLIGLTYALTYKSAQNPEAFVDEVASQLILYPLSKSKKTMLLDTLLEGAIPEDWSTSSPMAETRIKNFIKVLMRLPEYQLC